MASLHPLQPPVELVVAVVGLVFLPSQEVLLGSADGPVAQTLTIVARENELHGRIEPLVEFGLLVGQTRSTSLATNACLSAQSDLVKLSCGLKSSASRLRNASNCGWLA